MVAEGGWAGRVGGDGVWLVTAKQVDTRGFGLVCRCDPPGVIDLGPVIRECNRVQMARMMLNDLNTGVAPAARRYFFSRCPVL